MIRVSFKQTLSRLLLNRGRRSLKLRFKAMAYRRRESPYEKARKPDLILLDLTLPIKDGREVLA